MNPYDEKWISFKEWTVTELQGVHDLIDHLGPYELTLLYNCCVTETDNMSHHTLENFLTVHGWFDDPPPAA